MTNNTILKDLPQSYSVPHTGHNNGRPHSCLVHGNALRLLELSHTPGSSHNASTFEGGNS